MASKRFLALDLGAESGRAVLGSLDGGHLALAEVHRFANPTGNLRGQLQWNLLAQWEQIKVGVARAAAASPDIDGIGVDTWGVDFGLIGHDGAILGNPVHYRDRRTDGILQRAFRRAGREEVFQATGLQTLPFNTLFQLLALHESGSDLLSRARRLLWMPDLFHYLLAGTQTTEFSIASTSQMLDPHSHQWAKSLLERFDVPMHILPEIKPSGTVLGPMLAEVAEACGCRPFPVIAPASHDTASAVAAVPAARDDWCYISSGTWSLVGVEIERPILTPLALRYNYANEGGVGGRVRFLKNIAGLWLVQECRRQWQFEGQDWDYTTLADLAASAAPLGALIDPNHPSFVAPGHMPQKIIAFCQATAQPAPTSPGQFVRTCLEGLALSYRATLAELEEIVGSRIRTIHIVGGGSQNALLNQLTADACNRQVIAGPSEATAAGNILVQALAVGAIDSLAQARTIVAASFPVQRYQPNPSQPWDRAADRFAQLLLATNREA